MTANARIAERLKAMADHLEFGARSAASVGDEMRGHTDAVEGIPYGMVTEATSVWAQVERARLADRLHEIDPQLLANWLRDWASRIPCEPIV